MRNTMTITIEGKETECKIIFTYKSEEFNHTYVVFRVGDTDEITAMILEEKDELNGTLSPITNDAEWDLLQDALDEFFAQQEENGGCDCCEGDCGCCGEHEEDCECDHDHECSCCSDHE